MYTTSTRICSKLIALFSNNGFVVERGPDLIEERTGHSGAMMKIDGKTILVVVGGLGLTGFIDTELLDLSEHWPRWKRGNNNF